MLAKAGNEMLVAVEIAAIPAESIPFIGVAVLPADTRVWWDELVAAI
jgi:hypothetical protein